MKEELFYFDVISKARETYTVVPVAEDQVKGEIAYPCVLFLDQATKTGFSIWDDKRRLVHAGRFTKDGKESLADYKYGLKDKILGLIEKYQLRQVWYEEAYDSANHHTTEVLYYIKHMITDLRHEMGKELEVYGVDHTRWKSLLASPKAFKKTSDDKAQVKSLVQVVYPLLNLPEDTTDAIGMGIALVLKTKEKNMVHNARINKKLPIFADVFVLKSGEDLATVVRKKGKKYWSKMDEHGLHEIEFVTSRDELMNGRYALSFRDGLFWAEIPSHPNFGQILLHYGIVPKTIEDGDRVVMIAARKK